MLSSKVELLEALDNIEGSALLVAGDLILDRYIWGSVDRISPEAPVPVVHVGKIEDRLGGAGNVLRNLSRLGARVSVSGFVGDDPEGKQVLKLLEDLNVNQAGVIVDQDCPTCVKARVIAHRQQVVRIDREERIGCAPALQQEFASGVEAKLDAVQALVISDYAKGTITAPLMSKLAEALRAGRTGLGVCPVILDPKPLNNDIYTGVTAATPNRREAELASGIAITSREHAAEAARILVDKWGAEIMLVTLGEDGMVMVSAESPEGIFLDVVARDVYDVSGAGDTVVAVFAAAIAGGARPAVAGDLANMAAGVVVTEVGTVAIERETLQSEIERLAG